MEKICESCDAVELPVEFAKLEKAISELDLAQYDVVYLLGLAGSRDRVTPEKVALNWCYCPGRPDNTGQTFEEGEELIKGSEMAHLSTFPVEELTSFLKARGIDSELSFTAGTYVCNATYYRVLKALQGSATQACFIHMPQDIDREKLAAALVDFIL